MWHCGSGIEIESGKVATWRSIHRGIPLINTDAASRPVLATDGSYFNGRPVVQFDVASASKLQALNVSPMLGDDALPMGLAAVARVRSTPPTGAFFSSPWVDFYNDTGRIMLIWRTDTSGFATYTWVRQPSGQYSFQWWSPSYVGSALTPVLSVGTYDYLDDNTHFYETYYNTPSWVSGAGLTTESAQWIGCGAAHSIKVGNHAIWAPDYLDISIAAIVVMRHGFRTPQTVGSDVEMDAFRAALCDDFGVV